MTATLRAPTALAEAGLIPADRLPELEAVAARYAVAVTPALAGLIDPHCGHDPIAAQFLPDARELITRDDELSDPISDQAMTPVKGVVHRYADRCLLKVTHTCAVYCRFCFRREAVGPGGGGELTGSELDAALAYVADHPQIWEVILTGGDPLVLSDRRLADLLGRLARIGHVKVIRIHTRMPVADPARITPALAAVLAGAGRPVWIALHANHARELTPAARAACARLVDAGLPMVSQSVLLRGVNDTPRALADLMRAFVETRIKPYYLHHADLAPGTGHLRTTLAEGQGLMRQLRGDLSGLAQPTYVLDIPGGHGKAPVGPGYLDADFAVVTDPAGARHAYPPGDAVRQAGAGVEPPGDADDQEG